jgi:hypothetical protein
MKSAEDQKGSVRETVWTAADGSVVRLARSLSVHQKECDHFVCLSLLALRYSI